MPKNLYFVATMNTADRSIALLDAAMRRRFAFVELHPATEPTKSLLPRWLAFNSKPSTAGALLQRLNEAIDDRDAHIGPSYFIHADQSRSRLERVWRTQIIPLLQEHHYDRWASVARTFDFDTMFAQADGASPVGPELDPTDPNTAAETIEDESAPSYAAESIDVAPMFDPSPPDP
ncbi:hypothetical protein BH24ACT5_BH24ACT5_26530 [soil metagenome]